MLSSPSAAAEPSSAANNNLSPVRNDRTCESLPSVNVASILLRCTHLFIRTNAKDRQLNSGALQTGVPEKLAADAHELTRMSLFLSHRCGPGFLSPLNPGPFFYPAVRSGYARFSLSAARISSLLITIAILSFMYLIEIS